MQDLAEPYQVIVDEFPFLKILTCNLFLLQAKNWIATGAISRFLQASYILVRDCLFGLIGAY